MRCISHSGGGDHMEFSLLPGAGASFRRQGVRVKYGGARFGYVAVLWFSRKALKGLLFLKFSAYTLI